MKFAYKLRSDVKLREFQRRFYERITSDGLPARWVFINAPTGSGKTLLSLLVARKCMDEGVSPLILVRTRSQLSSFVRDSWRFFDSLPNVYLNKAVACRLLARDRSVGVGGEASIDDFPSCRQCPYYDRNIQEAFKRVVEFMEERKIYDPYAVQVDVDYCPYRFWRSMECVGCADVLPPTVMTYAWVFMPWLRTVLSGWMESKRLLGIFDEAHNLDNHIVDVVGRLSYRAVDYLVRNSGILSEEGLYTRDVSRFLTALRGLSDLMGFMKARLSDGCLLGFEVRPDLYRRLEDRVRKVIVFASMVDELLGEVKARAKRYLDAGDQNSVARAMKLELYARNLRMLRIFTSLFWKYANNSLGDYYVLVWRDGGLEVVNVETKNLFRKISGMFDAGLFISGTLPDRDYVVNVWGFPEDEIEYVDVLLNGFGKVNWRFNYSVTTRYECRNSLLYNNYAVDIEREFRVLDEGVMLVVFPSYTVMTEVYKRLNPDVYSSVLVEGKVTKLGDVYKFVESRRKAMVFAVFGGKLCEGVELVDYERKSSLIRKVYLVGIPYEKPAELIEAILEKNGIDRWVFLNTRAGMKVRQALGRAVRFESDEVEFVLADARYGARFWRSLFFSKHKTRNGGRRVRGNVRVFRASRTSSINGGFAFEGSESGGA